MVRGEPESFGLVQPQDTFSLRHPSLPPSALGRRTFHRPEHATAPLEDVAHQMAEILRAVEAKVRRIEVRDESLHVRLLQQYSIHFNSISAVYIVTPP